MGQTIWEVGMSRSIASAAILTVGAVVAVGLITIPPVMQPGAEAALGPVQSITLTGADLHPSTDDTDFSNQGYSLFSDGNHMARIPFPAEKVLITKVTYRVRDHRSTGDLCVSVYRVRPAAATEDSLGSLCTWNDSTNPQEVMQFRVDASVGGFQTPYVWVTFDEKSSDLRLYGVTVFYRVIT
jgi:hypothetical protein